MSVTYNCLVSKQGVIPKLAQRAADFKFCPRRYLKLELVLLNFTEGCLRKIYKRQLQITGSQF